jgi:hypothetical protein
MNSFDIIYIMLLAFFFFRGWIRGMLHAIIGPACLAFWTVIGIINYDLTENIIKAITITIVGSFLTSAAIHLLLFIGRRSVHKDHRGYVFIGSRLLGGILNVGWNGLLTAFLAITLTLMPLNFLGLKNAQKNIETSATYAKFYTYLISPFPTIRNVLITVSVFKNYSILKRYKDTPEYQAVFSHPKIQQLINNPDLMKKFYSKDSLSLLKDPYIRDLIQDQDLITNISNLGKRIYTDRTMQ